MAILSKLFKKHRGKRFPIQDLFEELNDLSTFDKSALKKYEKFAEKIDYVIAMSPRTGSTALCSLLSKTELVGNPTELFNPRGVIQNRKETLDAHSFIEYIEKTILKYRINHFGVKIAWIDFEYFAHSGLDKILFKNSKFIYLDRNDEIAQAVSLFHAVVAKKFHYNYNSAQSVSINNDYFNIEQISTLLKEIKLQKSGWISYFNKNNKSFLKLTYEDFQENLPLAATQVLDYLNIQRNINWNQINSDFVKVDKPYLEGWKKEAKRLLEKR